MRLPRPGFRSALALLLLALGVALTLLDPRDALLPGLAPSDGDDVPNYVIEGAHLTRFDSSGRAYQRVETPRLVNTPDDITRLERPVAQLIDDDQRRWVATALVGRLSSRRDLLTLEGQARLFAPEERWQLDTDTLHYDGNTGHAWSDDYSVLRQPPQRMTGQRFDAWLNDDHATLTDNVRGYHPPAPPETSAP